MRWASRGVPRRYSPPRPTAGSGSAWLRATVARAAPASSRSQAWPRGQWHRPHTPRRTGARHGRRARGRLGGRAPPTGGPNRCGPYLARLGGQGLAGGRHVRLVAGVDVAHRARRAVHPQLRGPISQIRPDLPWSARCSRPARTDWLTWAAFLARRETGGRASPSAPIPRSSLGWSLPCGPPPARWR
jgi:hypothetical protein